MNVACSNRVVSRNNFGRFIAQCEQAAELTAKEAVERGANLSRAKAPVGKKSDPRTPKLADSIETQMLSSTSGVWRATARHALPIEKGAGPHDIPADVKFFWEREGRMWMHPDTYQRVTGFPGADPIKHPGNAAQPYLMPAYRQIAKELMSIARKYYP